jgi:hypothetical protein
LLSLQDTTTGVVGLEGKLGASTDTLSVVSSYQSKLYTRVNVEALRTGRQDFLEISRKLADRFLLELGPTGVPEWDFNAPRPCPYDASAATITARGLQMLYELILPNNQAAAEEYLRRGFKLIEDTLRECWASDATLKDGKVDFGKDGWEPILAVSPVNRYIRDPWLTV